MEKLRWNWVKKNPPNFERTQKILLQKYNFAEWCKDTYVRAEFQGEEKDYNKENYRGALVCIIKVLHLSEISLKQM